MTRLRRNLALLSIARLFDLDPGFSPLTEPLRNWTGALGSPKRTWAENDMFRLLLAD